MTRPSPGSSSIYTSSHGLISDFCFPMFLPYSRQNSSSPIPSGHQPSVSSWGFQDPQSSWAQSQLHHVFEGNFQFYFNLVLSNKYMNCSLYLLPIFWFCVSGSLLAEQPWLLLFYRWDPFIIGYQQEVPYSDLLHRSAFVRRAALKSLFGLLRQWHFSGLF